MPEQEGTKKEEPEQVKKAPQDTKAEGEGVMKHPCPPPITPEDLIRMP